MLREIKLPATDQLKDRVSDVPVISAAFLEDLRSDPMHSARMEKVLDRLDQRQAVREAAGTAADLIGITALMAADVCTIAMNGDGLAATREIVRGLSPFELS
ncbi:MAG TPA: hypothetical protein VHC21_03050 [Candidatus Saccharimonadales bacterium]|nr:hypothetical protein [Candidatus Saccharimonadales bacterium]